MVPLPLVDNELSLTDAVQTQLSGYWNGRKDWLKEKNVYNYIL
jgi:hypothetical protein